MREAISSPNIRQGVRSFITMSLLGVVSLTGCGHSEGVDKVVAKSRPVHAAAPSPQVEKKPEVVKKPNISMIIIGNEKCRQDTEAALELIRDKAPKHFEVVSEYIKIIECVPKGSGMRAWEVMPRFMVGDVVREAGTLEFAGDVVHDANHSRLYHQYLDKNPGMTVPLDVWTGKGAEATCLAAQADALGDMGAPKSTIDRIDNEIKKDYWKIPYVERYW